MEAYQRLEAEFAEWAGAANVVACSSGTAALHLSLEALRLPPGAAVIVPDFTMIACPRAVSLAGLVPVFVDCTNDLLLDLDCVDEAASIFPDVRAVMPVHVYGRQCPMRELMGLAAKFDLAVIEDLAEAHGVTPHPLSDAAVWSFYANKIIAGEEGGLVAFRDPECSRLARLLRCQGFTAAHDFTHVPRGHNYRLANALATLILGSLRNAAENIRRRRLIEGWYDALCPEAWKMPPRSVPWVYDVRIPGITSETQGALVRELQAAGIPARHAFKPCHLQEEYRHCRRIGGENAERLSRELCYLPISPGVTAEADAARSFSIIRRAAEPRTVTL